MSVPYTILKISEEVDAETLICDEVTPASGKSIKILRFEGNAAFSKNVVVRISYGAENIWTIKGEMPMPHEVEIAPADVDGIKKLSLCCDNGETGPVWMSGFVEALVE